MFFFWIVFSIVIAAAVWLGFWSLLTLVSRRSHWQAEFVAGKLPDSLPDGFYEGTAHLLGGRPVPWLGKFFEPAHHQGFNIFTPAGAILLKLVTPFYKGFRENTEGNTDAYYFKTSASAGFRDTQIDTFKLDYNSPGNPFLIRIILDEIVETAPNEFLGKVHMKVFPGYYSTIGFFGLRK